MTLTPAQLGLARGLGVAILLAVLTFIGDSANLNGIVSVSAASIISGLALSLEHYLEAKSGNTTALFGAVKKTQ